MFSEIEDICNCVEFRRYTREEGLRLIREKVKDNRLMEIKRWLISFSEQPETFREYIIYERIRRSIMEIIDGKDSMEGKVNVKRL